MKFRVSPVVVVRVPCQQGPGSGKNRSTVMERVPKGRETRKNWCSFRNRNGPGPGLPSTTRSWAGTAGGARDDKTDDDESLQTEGPPVERSRLIPAGAGPMGETGRSSAARSVPTGKYILFFLSGLVRVNCQFRFER
jgi:hypothetical protein